jgi:hypothetical protein
MQVIWHARLHVHYQKTQLPKLTVRVQHTPVGTIVATGPQEGQICFAYADVVWRCVVVLQEGPSDGLTCHRALPVQVFS